MPVVESAFPMAPISKSALGIGRWLVRFLMNLMIPIGFVVIAVAIFNPRMTSLLAMLGMLLSVGAAVGFVAAIERASRAMADLRFEVGASGLKIVSKLYGREFPRESLKVDEARLIDLHKEWGHKPGMSATGPLGLNLFGSCVGAYRLFNRQKALLFLAFPASKPAVWVPTTSGLPLLLSPDDPEGFLEALRAAK